MAVNIAPDTAAARSAQQDGASVLEIASLLTGAGANCEVGLPDGRTLRFGKEEPAFKIVFRTDAALKTPLTEMALGSAYVEGRIDFEGDMREMLDVRDHLAFGTTLAQKLRFAYELLLKSPTKVNRKAIHEHYTLGDDFYLTFIDQRYRFYSHCLFHDAEEELEEAAEHKLESMWNALGLEPGMRLLDIGGGWGGVTEYCGARGVHVTSITLVEDSANYIRALISEKKINGEVILGDILDLEVAEPFDHAVIYGVIEHIPNYARFCARVWDALKPSGRLYLDASAVKEKFAISPFTRKFTWPGHHSFLAVQDMVRELLLHGFEVVEVARETRDYELTITHWAERFDTAREEIVARWGEETYRAFRVFLWGGAHAFKTNRLQAYHVVSERRADPGPRPGFARRAAGFVGSMV
ncbi:MAG TPA: class I SAM-dependent methyltransferase [Solirubrobacteraceae bacterium]|nr:class I SAM-dependent methyltransferase [Solirubrobacteraceae bacterium]